MKTKGEHQQTGLPMAECLRMQRFREWKRLSWRLLVAGALLGYLAVDSMLEHPCRDAITPRHSQEEIEEMVAAVGTPLEAFTRIETDIVFHGEHDARFCHCSDRWTSLRETYALGSGDCEDGAIAFAAMLHDDAQFDVRVVQLMGRRKTNSEAVGGSAGHAIAVAPEALLLVLQARLRDHPGGGGRLQRGRVLLLPRGGAVGKRPDVRPRPAGQERRKVLLEEDLKMK
jgi:hypothetical protein